MHWSSDSSESEDDEIPRFRRRARMSRISPHIPTTPDARSTDLNISPGPSVIPSMNYQPKLRSFSWVTSSSVIDQYVRQPSHRRARPPRTFRQQCHRRSRPHQPLRQLCHPQPAIDAENGERTAHNHGRVPAPPLWSVNTLIGMLSRKSSSRRTRLRISAKDGVYTATMKPDGTVIVIFHHAPK